MYDKYFETKNLKSNDYYKSQHKKREAKTEKLIYQAYQIIPAAFGALLIP